jgi:DNA integrity scanning protein DisA with diadenylate cyclase activity
MEVGRSVLESQDSQARLDAAIRQSAPGTALRHALDMIIAGHLWGHLSASVIPKMYSPQVMMALSSISRLPPTSL